MSTGANELTERRLVRVAVLQELTVAALDLFERPRGMDAFLERLADRVGCLAAVCIEDVEGGARLLGAIGISSAARRAKIQPRDPLGATRALPYPELARGGLTCWRFPLAGTTEILVFFDGEPRVPAKYRSMLERVMRVVGTALEHGRLHARALEQKTLLEAQNESTLEGILIVSAEGEVASANRRFFEIWGIPPEKRGVRSLDELVRAVLPQLAEPDVYMARSLWLRERTEGEFREEIALVDGRTIERTSAPIRSADGTVYGRGFYSRDVTDKKRAERERVEHLAVERTAREAAETAARRAKFLAEASTLLASSIDYETTLRNVARLVVPQMADLCIIDLLDAPDRVRRVSVVHADPAKERVARALEQRVPDLSAPEGLARVFRTGKPVQYEVARLFDVDAGGWSPIVSVRDPEYLRILADLEMSSYIAVPLVVAGRTVGALSFGWGGDPARHGAPDMALAQEIAWRAALAVENARLYRAAQDALRAAREAIAVRDEFLSVASHELRTPLTSLGFAVQSLVRGMERGAPVEHVRRALAVTERQQRRLSKLVEGLLDVTHVAAGKLYLELAPTDLVETVRDVLEQLGEQLALAKCAVTVHAKGPVIGEWDRFRLEQVVTNLVTNAFKYGAGKPIEVTVEGDEQTARLGVRDHGIGIPVEQQDQLFERFKRGVSARHFGGLGLGLYIVRQIVDALGGKVRVESAAGAGAAFWIELPLRPPARAKRAA